MKYGKLAITKIRNFFADSKKCQPANPNDKTRTKFFDFFWLQILSGTFCHKNRVDCRRRMIFKPISCHFSILIDFLNPKIHMDKKSFKSYMYIYLPTLLCLKFQIPDKLLHSWCCLWHKLMWNISPEQQNRNQAFIAGSASKFHLTF